MRIFPLALVFLTTSPSSQMDGLVSSPLPCVCLEHAESTPFLTSTLLLLLQSLLLLSHRAHAEKYIHVHFSSSLFPIVFPLAVPPFPLCFSFPLLRTASPFLVLSFRSAKARKRSSALCGRVTQRVTQPKCAQETISHHMESTRASGDQNSHRNSIH